MAFSGGNGIFLLEFAPGWVGTSEFDLNEVGGELTNERHGKKLPFGVVLKKVVPLG